MSAGALGGGTVVVVVFGPVLWMPARPPAGASAVTTRTMTQTAARAAPVATARERRTRTRGDVVGNVAWKPALAVLAAVGVSQRKTAKQDPGHQPGAPGEDKTGRTFNVGSGDASDHGHDQPIGQQQHPQHQQRRRGPAATAAAAKRVSPRRRRRQRSSHHQYHPCHRSDYHASTPDRRHARHAAMPVYPYPYRY